MNVEDVKRTVTMSHILSRYGLSSNRYGYISCPFHSEKTPSMKIFSNSYYCFGCGKGGDVFSFVMEYEGVSFKEAFALLGGDVENYEPISRNDRKKQKRDWLINRYKKVHPDCGCSDTDFNFGAIREVSRDQNISSYLERRGLSEYTLNRYFVTNPKGNDKLISFLFVDENGMIQSIKLRKNDKHPSYGDGKCKEWFFKNENGNTGKRILFGMYQCNLENKRLILTEGQIDSLSVAESGVENAVSVPTGKYGLTWLENCLSWLNSFDTLIVFGDLEKDGTITLLADMRKYFHGNLKYVRPENYRGCKDANELLQKHGKEAVVYAVEYAVFCQPEKEKRDVIIRQIRNMKK